MSDSKSETVDHWSFVEGVKNPLGRLADACLDAYEENGNPLLEEAANALRAIETVNLDYMSIEYPFPWHYNSEIRYIVADDSGSDMLKIYGDSNGDNALTDKEYRELIECINTVHALQTKNGD